MRYSAQYDISFIPVYYWDYICIFCSAVGLHQQVQGSSDTVRPKKKDERKKARKKYLKKGGRSPVAFVSFHLPQPPGHCGDHMFHTWPYFDFEPICSEEFSSLKSEIKHGAGFAGLPQLLPSPHGVSLCCQKTFLFCLHLFLWPRSQVPSASLISLWASALGGYDQLLLLPFRSARKGQGPILRLDRASLSACRMPEPWVSISPQLQFKCFAMCLE